VRWIKSEFEMNRLKKEAEQLAKEDLEWASAEPTDDVS